MIEVVVVVALIGILAVAVAPEVSQQLRNSQVRNAAESIATGLQKARAEAISRNTSVRFTLVTDLGSDCAASSVRGSWVVSRDDPDSLCDVGVSETVQPRILALQLAADGGAIAVVKATLADNTTQASSIVFNAFGRPSGAAGQINRILLTTPTDGTGDRAYRVDISPLGAVRVCDKKVTASGDPRLCPT